MNTPYHNPERAPLKPLYNTNHLCVDKVIKTPPMLNDRQYYGVGRLYLPTLHTDLGLVPAYYHDYDRHYCSYRFPSA